MNTNLVIKKDQKKILSRIWTGGESQIDYSITLAGSGADVTLLMLLLGRDNSNLNVRINVSHLSPQTKSRVIVKGVLTGSSQVDFEGLVQINQGAKNSDTWLAAHLLLLSDDAAGRAVPNLEIAENEVKAGHASTVGKINESELFYLMSRGLTKNAAMRLIVEGFLNSMLKEFPDHLALKVREEIKWI